MKKVLSVIMAIALLCCAAFAAEIKPVQAVDMAASLDDATLRIGFTEDAVSDKAIIADVYEKQTFAGEEIADLQIGDVITCMGEEVTVESIETDYSVLINGGYEAGGLTLFPEEDGSYTALHYESPCYLMVGQVELILADELTYSHWQEDAEGGIMDEPAVQTVAAAELKGVLTADGNDEFYPGNMVARCEGGKVVELTAEYTP